MEIQTGLHRIGDDVIAAYLLVDDGGVTVIDAGLPGHRRALRRELRRLGLSEEDVRGVILTHADSDHLGFAEALRADYGIPVFVASAEEAYARREVAAPQTQTPPWRLRPALQFFWVALRNVGRVRPLREVVTVSPDEQLDLPGTPRIIAAPGHTAGHIAVFSERHGALFVGDALTTRHVLTGAGPVDAPFSEQPEIAQMSVDTLAAIDTAYVLPGHGPIWRGQASELVAQIRASRLAA